ncbi:hypothetical protein EWM64_g9152 [Hericium alpestre]|uniref:Uncharacterized protein n=1 Tax=Hericium alpestre TaxID=135208 RepID=A0A4Y9ZN60_9AGAM|nr:hypothetical protein EWM64_g9152 [Hericium alpestre]
MASSTSSRDASFSLASLRSASAAAASSYSPIPTKPAVNVQQSKPQQSISHPMSTTVIVLLALGGVCVLGAILVVVKLRRRPKRRWPPTPSLPILQDQDYPKEKAAGGGAKGKGDESPIFGGKERFSSRPGSNAVLWNWTQYQSGIPKPPPAAKGGDARASAIDAQRRFSRIDDATTAKIQQATSATYVQPQIVQNTAPRTPSRLSTVSLYPGTNYPQSNEHIGIAVSELPGTKAGADSSATAVKSGAQDFGRRRSVRRSMRDLRDLERRRTTLYDGADSLAYVEPDMSSPSILPVAQGRERIKAPYGAGSYLRTSTSASAVNHASVATDSNPFEEPAYAVPPMPYPHSNEERRDRNTKTLTSALGLASPAPPSPEPTLYPDDSLSVVGDRRHVASQKKHLAQTKLGSPGTEATALGNMMLSDYRTSKHGGPVTDGRGHGGTPDDVLGALDSPDDFAPLRMHRRRTTSRHGCRRRRRFRRSHKWRWLTRIRTTSQTTEARLTASTGCMTRTEKAVRRTAVIDAQY